MKHKIRQYILTLASIITSLWIAIIPSSVSAVWFGSMMGVTGVNVPWTTTHQEDSLMHTIQTAINWVLGILATVSLCLVLYAGFLTMTSWWDSKKFDSWVSIIKNAAIGLAIIAVSWLIVSLIFYLINGSINPNIVSES